MTRNSEHPRLFAETLSEEDYLLNHPENIVRDYTLDRDLDVLYLDNTLVMPVISSGPEEKFVHRGGVYSQSGEFIPLSGKMRRNGSVLIGPYPQEVVSKSTPTHTYAMPAIFCGYIDNAFGHFLLETASRLWWTGQDQTQYHYVFQIRKNQSIPSFVVEFFELLGIADRVIYVNELACFKQLVIPESAFELRSFFHPDFLIPFRQIRKTILQKLPESRPKKVYLSRTKLKNRQVVGEDTVAKMFSDIGFEIVSPEDLTLTEQIKLIVGADEIAGAIGSALHLLVFSQDAKVIYIIPDKIKNSNYSIVDQATNATPINIFARGALRRPKFNRFKDILFFLDLQKVQIELVENGYPKAGMTDIPSIAAMKNLYWQTWAANNEAH